METIMNASKGKSKGKSLSGKRDTFNAQAFLDSAGLARTVRQFKGAATIFSQGSPAESVLYIQEGSVKITALIAAGKETIIAILCSRDFFAVQILTAITLP